MNTKMKVLVSAVALTLSISAQADEATPTQPTCRYEGTGIGPGRHPLGRYPMKLSDTWEGRVAQRHAEYEGRPVEYAKMKQAERLEEIPRTLDRLQALKKLLEKSDKISGPVIGAINSISPTAAAVMFPDRELAETWADSAYSAGARCGDSFCAQESKRIYIK